VMSNKQGGGIVGIKTGLMLVPHTYIMPVQGWPSHNDGGSHDRFWGSVFYLLKFTPPLSVNSSL
jgi:hypothetical protein